MVEKIYNVIVPALDRTGPVNVAMDLAEAAFDAGWCVTVLYLSDCSAVGYTGRRFPVRKFSFWDIWRLRGVVHTHCLRPDLLGALLSSRRQVNLVTTLHNFFLPDLLLQRPRWLALIAWHLWKRAITRFDWVFCISQAMIRYYRKTIPNQKMLLAYNFRGACASEEVASEVIDWINQRRTFGDTVISFAGSISKRKNICNFVRALEKIEQVSLVICGDGPDRRTLSMLVHELGLSHRVLCLGHVSSPSSIIAKTDALALPSLAEGFPLVVIEAASVGVPSLMSNIAVHRELAALGFGVNFDHRRFFDLEVAIGQIRALRSLSPDCLIQLWQRRFTPTVGFSAYENEFIAKNGI